MPCLVLSRMTPTASLIQFQAFDPYNAGLTLAQAVAIEGTLAFNLIFVALSVFDPMGWRPLPASMPTLALAFTLASGIMVAVSRLYLLSVTSYDASSMTT